VAFDSQVKDLMTLLLALDWSYLHVVIIADHSYVPVMCPLYVHCKEIS
jgi:hypothetical protein